MQFFKGSNHDFFLDRSSALVSLGCRDLLRAVAALQPRLHVFGDIHGSYGYLEMGGTTFINVSVMDSRLGPVNAPVVVEV